MPASAADSSRSRPCRPPSPIKLANEQELQRISDALDELATIDSALAETVDLKFFCGFSFGEIAAMRDVSERTVQRQWEKARLFLHRTLGDGAQGIGR